MAPRDAPPPEQPKKSQAAAGGPVGVGHPTYADTAARLFDNGYEPIPIVPGLKRPALSRWSTVEMTEARIDDWSEKHALCGVGLRTGALLGLDIDLLDPDLAHAAHELAVRKLGETIVRVGHWPKRFLLYRASTPGRKRSIYKIEALGRGQQFVAFGVHPDTGSPYYWATEDSPLDFPLSDLPIADNDTIEAYLSEATAFVPRPDPPNRRRKAATAAGTSSGPVRNDRGIVQDGRDGWLSSIAFHVVHDAIERGELLDAGSLAEAVWRRFENTTDLSRQRKDGGRAYGFGDAIGKVEDKLWLHREGRLPARAKPEVAPPDLPAAQPVEAARTALDEAIETACARIADWWAGSKRVEAPQIGLRATVGLGKSAAARKHLLRLQAKLKAAGAPSRIAVFTPSLDLADEAAEAWRREGASVAVHRGYDRKDPASGAPLCRNLDAVRIAIEAGAHVHRSICDDGKGRRCPYFEGCLKQANRRATADADVVFAAYDALFTGFAAETSSFGALLIDEACWPRARRDTERVHIARFADGPLEGLRARGGAMAGFGDQADLADLRRRAAEAFKTSGSGPLDDEALRKRGLTAKACGTAAELESKRIRKIEIRPGEPLAAQAELKAEIERNREAARQVRLWRAMADFIELGSKLSGRIRITGGEDGEVLEVALEGVRSVHLSLRETPVLHLDAGLRPELARSILPRLETSEVVADAPNMSLKLVTGGFGKSALIEDARASAEENARRASRLARCVDYVQWEALRAAPRRVLVATHKDCEAAFAAIPGVETVHFNALAGLDLWGDVGLLIVIGRPLPRDTDAARLAATFFDRPAEGAYRWATKGVLMRDGSTCAVRTLEHSNEDAEALRAAICDDELIQAIGRGRGVNRTRGDPLEVQVLADVALPLTHDRLTTWDVVQPDIVQRMLLEGLAVDSPADAVLLHPALLASEKQAQKQFERIGFKRQIPLRDIYREMSLKSARYRLPCKGRGWSSAWWLSGCSLEPKETLERVLGPLAEWRPDKGC